MYYLDEIHQWQHWFQLHPTNDVQTTKAKIKLFIWFFVIEQLAEIIALTGQASNNQFQIPVFNMIATISIFIMIESAHQKIYSYRTNLPTQITAHPYKIKRPHQKTERYYAILIGTGIAIGLIIIQNIYEAHVPQLLNVHLQNSTNQTNINSFIQFQYPYLLIDICLITLGLAPLVEEFMFRYLFFTPHFDQQPIRKILLSTFAFGTFHMITQIGLLVQSINGFKTWWVLAIPYFMIGGGLSISFMLFHNLRFNVFTHRYYNIIIMTALILNVLIKSTLNIK